MAEIILPHQLSYNQLIDRVVERDTLRVSGELTPAKSKKIEVALSINFWGKGENFVYIVVG